jgi:indolepyruvate ferredoxin oxidoreductase beta subunit
LIPYGKVDIIMSLEPMEALRYVEELSKDGWIVTSSVPFVNIPNYPDKEEIYAHLRKLPHTVMLDVEALAKEAGAPAQAANMVLLGAAVPMLGFSYDSVKDAVAKVFARKGEEIVAKNIAALEAGFRHSSNR